MSGSSPMSFEMFDTAELQPVNRAQLNQDFWQSSFGMIIRTITPSFLVERVQLGVLDEPERKEYVQERLHYILSRQDQIEELYQTGFNLREQWRAAQNQKVNIAALGSKIYVKLQDFFDAGVFQPLVNDAVEEIWRDLICARQLEMEAQVLEVEVVSEEEVDKKEVEVDRREDKVEEEVMVEVHREVRAKVFGELAQLEYRMRRLQLVVSVLGDLEQDLRSKGQSEDVIQYRLDELRRRLVEQGLISEDEGG